MRAYDKYMEVYIACMCTYATYIPTCIKICGIYIYIYPLKIHNPKKRNIAAFVRFFKKYRKHNMKALKNYP